MKIGPVRISWEPDKKIIKSYQPKIISTHESHRSFSFDEHYKIPIYICFGSYPKKIPENAMLINDIKSIEKSKDKLIMKYYFKLHNIPSPHFYWSFPKTKKKIICKQISHSCGRGMKFTNDKTKFKKFNTQYYFEKYTPIDTEFRIHVLNKEIIHVDKKTLREGNSYKETWVKNLQNYKYLEYTETLPIEIRKQIIKAVSCLGLYFGAVDLGYNSLKDKYYIFEVNSAPGMRSELRKKYQNKFKENFKKFKV